MMLTGVVVACVYWKGKHDRQVLAEEVGYLLCFAFLERQEKAEQP